MKLDALENEVILGNVYGYTTSPSSAFVHVVVGKAVRFTDKGVSLEVLSRTEYIYGSKCQHQDGITRRTVNVSSCLLFPIAGISV